MGISGSSGVGGQVGGMPQPSSKEIEDTAGMANLRLMMGVTPDSLDVSFTQLGGNPWKYQSSAGKPTIAPLLSLRVAAETPQGKEENWQAKFDALLKAYPEEIHDNLELRDLLKFAAKLLVWLDNVSQESVDKTTETRAQKNLELPVAALSGTINTGNEIVNGAQTAVQEMGANNPNFDALLNYSQQMQSGLEGLSALYAQFKDEGAVPQETASKVSDSISLLNEQFHHTNAGDALPILSPTLQAMNAVAHSLNLSNGAPSLFLSLHIASIGMNSADSSTGIVGKDLQVVLESLADGSSALSPNSNASDGLFMHMMLQVALITVMCGATILAERGIASKPNDEADPAFAFDLALHLAFGSGFAKALFETLGSAAGADPNQQVSIGQALGFVALLMIMAASSKGNQTQFEKLAESMHSYVFAGLDSMSKDVQDQETEQLGVSLEQGKIAASQGETETFVALLSDFLSSIGVAKENLTKDIEGIRGFAAFLTYALTSGLDDKTNIASHINQAAA